MKVGVVIGRFQIDNLHNGHIALIAEAFKNHKKVIVFLGCAPIIGTMRNPLDYPIRERMIKEAFPEAIVLPLLDNQSDKVWSKQVDHLIRLTFPNVTEAFLYGGRDSFIPHYHGDFTTVNIQDSLDKSQCSSSTETRELLGNVVGDSRAFRHGVIYSLQNYSFPTVRLAVDMAMTREQRTWVDSSDDKAIQVINHGVHEILMGRKGNEQSWRLPGGMVDPTDATAEEAGRRELLEETGMALAGPEAQTYLGTFKVHDWRIKKSPERGVMTCLFHAEYFSGTPKAGDDLGELSWIPLKEAEEKALNDHKPLVREVIKFLNAKKGK